MATAPQPFLPPLPPAQKYDPTDEGQAHFLRLKELHHMYFGREITPALNQMQGTADLVAGILPARSVNVLVGDSGVGKTPLAYQLALAVAAGVPFLGAATRQAKVLVVDYENSLWDANRILEQQRKHLGLKRYPVPWFLHWPVHNAVSQDEIITTIRSMAPDLVILDSLRSFCPSFESRNTTAAGEFKRLRNMATARGVATLLVHHLRRPTTRSLEDHAALDWLANAAGSRAVINQSDARLALAPSQQHENALVLRGFLRMRGELGPYLIRQEFTEEGDPRGFERFEPPSNLIGNPEQEAFFANLPAAFSFGEARRLYGKHNNTTNLCLHKLMQIGLLRKLGHGQYAKCESSTQVGGSQ